MRHLLLLLILSFNLLDSYQIHKVVPQFDLEKFSTHNNLKEPISKWPKYLYSVSHCHVLTEPTDINERTEDHKNFQEALNFVERHYLTVPLQKRSTKEIVTILCTINQIVNKRKIPLGRDNLRQYPIVFLKCDMSESWKREPTKIELADRYYFNRGEEYHIWQNFLDRSNEFLFLGDYYASLDENEWTQLEKIAVYLPHPKEIPSTLLSFAKEFKDLQSKNVDPIVLAAFAYETLILIHPFIDGNGRTSRTFMNIILAQVGISPIIIRNDPITRKGFKCDSFVPFYNYLVKRIKSGETN